MLTIINLDFTYGLKSGQLPQIELLELIVNEVDGTLLIR